MKNIKIRSKVLIVDDTQKNLQLLGAILLKEGYEILVANDGQEALDIIEEELPDLVLLDVMMPGIDGYEVCEKIKENGATKHIPVIFLTAKTQTEDIVKGFEVGGVDYVTKPFNQAELLARVKTHLHLVKLIGLIPICAHCKNVRKDEGLWEQIELYIMNHSHSEFSHTVCPDCTEKLYGHMDWYKKKYASAKE